MDRHRAILVEPEPAGHWANPLAWLDDPGTTKFPVIVPSRRVFKAGKGGKAAGSGYRRYYQWLNCRYL
jgi:hypothetical protein